MNKTKESRSTQNGSRSRILKISKEKSVMLKKLGNKRRSGTNLVQPNRPKRTRKNPTETRTSAVNHNDFFAEIEETESNESSISLNCTNTSTTNVSGDGSSDSDRATGSAHSIAPNTSVVSISSGISSASRPHTNFEKEMIAYMKEILIRIGALEKNVAKLDVRFASSTRLQSPDHSDAFGSLPKKLNIVDLNELRGLGLPVNCVSNLDALEQKLKCEEFTKNVVSEIFITLNSD